MLWNIKYAPKALGEFCGNAPAVEQVKRWALDWERGKPGKPLLIWGQPGTGKGALVFALATVMGWEVVEMNASDFRDRANVERVIGAASSSASLFGARKMIFVDDADALAGNADRGGGGAVLEVLKGARNPVILTAGNFWDRGISNLRQHCEGVEFKKINAPSIAAVLGKILEAEGIKAPHEVVAQVADKSNGDIRSAVNDLQAVAEGRKEISVEDLGVLSERNRERSVWDAVRTLMKTTSYDEAVKVTWNLDVEQDIFAKWVEENVPAEYQGADLARAFEALSRADIFAGRIHTRQYWGFMRYINVLLTAGVALAKERPYAKFVKYNFPGILKKLSASKIERAKIKAIGFKIGAKCHASSSEAAELFIPLVKVLMEADEERAPEIADYFELDVADVAFILEKSEAQVEKLLGRKAEKVEKTKPRRRKGR